MPFCEDSLLHKRFNHAQPAAAAAVWASEGTMSKSRLGGGHAGSGFLHARHVCAKPMFYHHR